MRLKLFNRVYRAGRRGFTLVEMTVVSGVAVVVLGLALGIAEQSEKVTRRITGQQGALQYCQSAIDTSVQALQGAVAAGDLPQAQVAGQYVFKADELTFASYAAGEGGALCLVSLRNRAAGAVGAETAELPMKVLQPINAATGQAEREQHEPLVRTAPVKFAPTIRFGYAGTAEPGQAVAYADTWTSNGMPKLVHITVEGAIDDGGSSRSLKLETSVRPGLGLAEGGAR